MKFSINRSTFVPLFLISLIIIAIACHSRSFIVGNSVALIFYYHLIKKRSARNKAISAVFCLLLVLLLVFFIKANSSQGRILINKISYQILKDHVYTGIGPGNFQKKYLFYQANYFRTGHYSQAELLLADNTSHCFNDYYQFIIETGLVGGLLILAAVGLIVKLGRKAFSRHLEKPLLLIIAYTQLIATCVAACFTYVFYLLIFQCIFFTLICILLYYSGYDKLSKKKLSLIFSIGVILLIGKSDGAYLTRYIYYEKFDDAKTLYHSGYIRESLTLYNQLYPYLKNDLNFLNGYADVLLTSGKSYLALSVMNKIVAKNPNSVYYQKLGDCYAIRHDYPNAEQAYLQAVYTVPNRFIPRYKLFNLYKLMLKIPKAILTGKDILRLPVKIPSQTIFYVKKDVNQNLNAWFPPTLY